MPELSHSELSTVLAALRLYQRLGPGSEELEVATDEGRCSPLSLTEIDELCERLNFETDLPHPDQR